MLLRILATLRNHRANLRSRKLYGIHILRLCLVLLGHTLLAHDMLEALKGWNRVVSPHSLLELRFDPILAYLQDVTPQI